MTSSHPSHYYQHHRVPLLTFSRTISSSHRSRPASVERIRTEPEPVRFRVGRSVFIRLLAKWVSFSSPAQCAKCFIFCRRRLCVFRAAPRRSFFSAFPWVKVNFPRWKVFPTGLAAGFRNFSAGKVQVSGWKLGKSSAGDALCVCVKFLSSPLRN